MYTENMQSHTSVENGDMKENKLGASFVGRLYRMEMPGTVSNMTLQQTAIQMCTPEHTPRLLT